MNHLDILKARYRAAVAAYEADPCEANLFAVQIAAILLADKACAA